MNVLLLEPGKHLLLLLLVTKPQTAKRIQESTYTSKSAGQWFDLWWPVQLWKSCLRRGVRCNLHVYRCWLDHVNIIANREDSAVSFMLSMLLKWICTMIKETISKYHNQMNTTMGKEKKNVNWLLLSAIVFFATGILHFHTSCYLSIYHKGDILSSCKLSNTTQTGFSDTHLW